MQNSQQQNLTMGKKTDITTGGNSFVGSGKLTSLTIYTNDAESASLLIAIHSEYARASNIYPKWPENLAERFAIVSEEFGEMAKAINDGDMENLRIEAIQSAAMCLRFLLSLNKTMGGI